MAAAAVPEAPELKQLEVVRTASVKAVETATSLATTAVGYTPAPVVSAATAVYDRVAPTVKPYAAATVDAVVPRAEQALLTADKQLDALITYFVGSYTMALDKLALGPKAMDMSASQYYARAQEIFALINSCLDTLTSRVNEAGQGAIEASQGAIEASQGAMQDAVAQVSAKMESLKAFVAGMSDASKEHITAHFEKLQAAWKALLARPGVAAMLAKTNTHIKYIAGRAEGLHDTIVADPRYSTLLDSASAWLTWAQATSIGAKLTAYASPYAEALAATSYAEAATPYATRAVEYWKPAPPLEGIKTK